MNPIVKVSTFTKNKLENRRANLQSELPYSEEPSRILFMDNAKSIASVLGIFFHAGLAFSTPWAIHIDEFQNSDFLLVFTNFLSYFRVPLFSFVAGYFTAYGFEKYGSKLYLPHRAKRILIPFFASLLILLPVQYFFILKFEYGSNWWAIFQSHMNPLNDRFQLTHLWFLYHTFIFSIAVLIYYKIKKKSLIPGFVSNLAATCHKKNYTALTFWVTLNMILYYLGAQIETHFSMHKAWFPAGFLGFTLPIFLFGWYCFRHKNAMETVLKPKPGFLAGLLTLSLILVPIQNFTIDPVLHQLSTILLHWCITFCALIFLKSSFTLDNRFSRYLVEASYPVYLFHHPIIIGLMFFYVQWNISLPVFWGYILVCSLGLLTTYFFYEIFVRRNLIGAFLFTGRSKTV